MLLLGDCLEKLKEIDDNSVDLIYLDPPFFTQKIQYLKTKDREKKYSFDDTWDSIDNYVKYIEDRLIECKRVLKKTGSIFLHCDKSASHYLRITLDKVFGYNNFQSEIIWTYKRWSNSKKGLLNNHQNIYFYSKTSDFKFNKIYTDYSVTTNVDQILQDRIRDKDGKSRYKKNTKGEVVLGEPKKGVPLSDVWAIPFLNPKAKERVGYPTQKPLLLLEQIIKISTEEGDVVLDPFVGSGTTIVAAKLLNRKYIGIDISKEAIQLTQSRLDNPIRTESLLLKKGKEKYKNLSDEEMKILYNIDAVPVQRNNGIDGFLKTHFKGKPVSIKVQKRDESLIEARKKLIKASKAKKCSLMILIRTHSSQMSFENIEAIEEFDDSVLLIIDSYDLKIENWMLINESNFKKSYEYIRECK